MSSTRNILEILSITLLIVISSSGKKTFQISLDGMVIANQSVKERTLKETARIKEAKGEKKKNCPEIRNTPYLENNEVGKRAKTRR